MRTGDPGSDPMLGELVVDMLPVPTADPGTTAPQFVARPGAELDTARSAR